MAYRVNVSARLSEGLGISPEGPRATYDVELVPGNETDAGGAARNLLFILGVCGTHRC